MPLPLLVCFAGGASGAWRVDSVSAVTGESLPFAPFLDVFEGDAAHAAQAAPEAAHAAWRLSGVVSSLRYATRAEVQEMNAARQEACQLAGAVPAAMPQGGPRRRSRLRATLKAPAPPRPWARGWPS